MGLIHEIKDTNNKTVAVTEINLGITRTTVYDPNSQVVFIVEQKATRDGKILTRSFDKNGMVGGESYD